MNDPIKTEPSVWERSTLVRSSRWLFSWRGMRRVFIVLAWSATIIGLWYGEENWRGRRAWNQYQTATEARGESLDFADYVPKPAPDDRNFAATPFLKSFLQRDNTILTNDLYARAIDHIAKTKKGEDKQHRQFSDLVAWQIAAAALQKGSLEPSQKFATDDTGLAARAAAAPAILEGLQPDQAALAELRAASTREFSRYGIKYDLDNPWGILIPHLAKIKGVCQRLNLQACAELALGQSGPALDDVKLSLALADSCKSEPFIISALVRGSCLQIAIQPVWEGLAEHRWTDAQLQELQARFLAYDFPADIQLPLLAERACGVLAVDFARKNGFGVLEDFGDQRNRPLEIDNLGSYLIGKLMPSGWYDREKLGFGSSFDALNQGVMDVTAKTVSPAKAASNSNDVTRQIFGDSSVSAFTVFLRHHAIAAMLLPALVKIPEKIAMLQTDANQAALACALERYRLAHGQFPDRLEDLTQSLMSRLPNDVITGQPYKYRRDGDGQFILYSVGWNEKDDGGVPGNGLFDPSQGDWVWQYPAILP